MNRNVSTRVLTAPARPARPTGLRRLGQRPQPKKSRIVGRILRWTVFLGIIGAIAASFFVEASDGKTYADLYTLPACKGALAWVKDKISPPEPEAETAKNVAAAAALDKKFEEAVAQREKAEAAKAPEAADEAVAFLEKELEASGRRIDVVREVGIEASKYTMSKTRVGTVQAMEELAAQARTQQKISAALGKRKSELDVKAAIAAVPPPPPPPAPPPPPPPVVLYDVKKLHAWPAQPVGTWVRWKKSAGETATHEDQVLTTLTHEAAVVRIEAVPGNQATSDRVFVFGADKARVLREETLKIGDAEFPCRVVQSGSTLRWIPKEGPAADRVALKTQVGDQTVVVTELGEEEIPVKGKPMKCLKYTAGDVTVWGHDEVPGFAVRVKTGAETSEAIDWGADLAARPATEKPVAVEVRSEQSLLAEAERLRVYGWVLLRDAIDAMKTPPSEPEALKKLYLDLDSASALLTKSREYYLSAKEKSPDAAAIDKTLSILGRLLEIAAKHSESIKVLLK